MLFSRKIKICKLQLLNTVLSSKSKPKLKKAHNLTCKTQCVQVLYNRPLLKPVLFKLEKQCLESQECCAGVRMTCMPWQWKENWTFSVIPSFYIKTVFSHYLTLANGPDSSTHCSSGTATGLLCSVAKGWSAPFL